MDLPIGRPCWEKPVEFVLRDAFTSSGSWISLLTGTASNETVVHQRPAGTGQSVKVGVCGARWSWVALWPFFRLRLWPVCLQSFSLCVFDIKLTSPVRVHLLLNYIDVLTFTLFERMEVFIVSASHQTSCHIKALAGQLIPVLAGFARVCNIPDQWTDSEPVRIWLPNGRDARYWLLLSLIVVPIGIQNLSGSVPIGIQLLLGRVPLHIFYFTGSVPIRIQFLG